MAYVPRLSSRGMRGNYYWYGGNPFYNAGYGLPNCTCYAWGRFWENSDINGDYSNRPNLSTGNAEDWWSHSDGYARGSTPALGAVLCLRDGPYSGEGHVGVVEVINSDNSIITSNSAWGGRYFYTMTLYPPHYLPAAGYGFQGFIYNPITGGGGGGGGGLLYRRPWLFKRELFNREDALIR